MHLERASCGRNASRVRQLKPPQGLPAKTARRARPHLAYMESLMLTRRVLCFRHRIAAERLAEPDPGLPGQELVAVRGFQYFLV